MVHRGIEKCFPDYYERFTLPPEAQEQELAVYRACPTRKIVRESFLDSFEENGFQPNPKYSEDFPSSYSMSAYMKVQDVRRYVVINDKYDPPYTLAKGITVGCCGKACLTDEWRKKSKDFPKIGKKKSSHVDWWLYQNSKPWEHFEEVDYEDEKSKSVSGTGGKRESTA